MKVVYTLEAIKSNPARTASISRVLSPFLPQEAIQLQTFLYSTFIENYTVGQLVIQCRQFKKGTRRKKEERVTSKDS